MMPDWNALVRGQLAGLSLEREERGEVIAELAAHLEEAFDELRQQGLPEELAAERALAQVKDWHALQRRIETARNKEELVTDRVKQWWLPGFVALFLSMVLLMANEFSGIKPLIVSAHGSQMTAPVAVIYLPWLLLLIPIGAVAAYLARRAGGSQRAIFLSIVFPVLPHLVLFLFAFPVSLIIEDHVAHNIMRSAFLVLLVVWVVVPGAALLAGGLPVQLFLSRSLSSRRIASH
jgi:hypothetical protein